jgi:MoaA/NifB/PqqE/SkfB family radical SAM enzyme
MIKNKQYFSLNQEVILNKRKDNCAIYNLRNGDVILINRDLERILRITGEGKPIEDVLVFENKKTDYVFTLLKDLENNNLGKFYTKRIYIEKYKIGSPNNDDSHVTPIFNTCYIEFPGECEFNCSFCGYPTLFQCTTCKRNKERADVSIIDQFLQRMIQTECRNLIFHGGDPVTCIDQLFTEIEYCRKKGYEGGISVISNGSQINQNIMEIFSRYKVQLILPVFMTSNTRQEYYLTKLANLAKRYKVPLTVSSVQIENEDSASMKEKIVEMKPDQNQIAMIYNKTRVNSENNPNQMLKTLQRVDANIFYHMKKHHPCLYGTIAISVSGDILPCPYLKTEILGNVQDSYWLENIFENESIYDYWDLPLSSIDKCRDCAFHFGCLDCRALEMQITGDLYGKSLCSLGINEQAK